MNNTSPSYHKKSIGDRFREIREERGYKDHKKWADHIGASEAHVRFIESGQRLPGHQTLLKYADATGLSPEQMFNGAVLWLSESGQFNNDERVQELERELAELKNMVKAMSANR